MFTAKTVNEAIDNILKEILTRNVQLQYSAQGRATHGVSKKNFSATEFCSILFGIFLRFYSLQSIWIVLCTNIQKKITGII